MKRILITALLLSAVTFSARAARVDWASLNTAASSFDTAPGLTSVDCYAAYYVEAKDVMTIFDSVEVNAITAKLKSDYAGKKASVEELGKSLNKSASGYYALNQYSFTDYSPSADSDLAYLAFVFYENGGDREFRVFGSDNADVYDTNLVFDDEAGFGAVSAWTAPQDVPEPTSALLMLLGLASLALRRSRHAA